MQKRWAAVAAVLSELLGILTLREEYKKRYCIWWTTLFQAEFTPNPTLRWRLAGLCSACAAGVSHHNRTHCVTFSWLACCVASMSQPGHTWLAAATWCGPWQLNSAAGLNFRHRVSLQRKLTTAALMTQGKCCIFSAGLNLAWMKSHSRLTLARVWLDTVVHSCGPLSSDTQLMSSSKKKFDCQSLSPDQTIHPTIPFDGYKR